MTYLMKRIECGFKDHGHYGLFMEIKIQNIFIAEQLRGNNQHNSMLGHLRYEWTASF